jgi:hypothetical protein
VRANALVLAARHKLSPAGVPAALLQKESALTATAMIRKPSHAENNLLKHGHPRPHMQLTHLNSSLWKGMCDLHGQEI